MSVTAHVRDECSLTRLRTYGTVDDKHQDLLSGVLDELLNSAVLTAATTSVANAVSVRAMGLAIDHLACYLPPPPTLYPEARQELYATAELSTRLGSYYDQMTFLRELVTRRCVGWHKPDDPVLAEITAFAGAWRSLSEQALSVIKTLIAALDSNQRRTHQDRINHVTYLLSRAAGGETPCIETYGVVTIPNWADRRSVPRRLRGFQSYLQVADSLQRVAVLDLSADGIGVIGLRNVPAGSRVGLLIKPGFMIGGTVIWSRASRAGIRLDSPLPADSQLLMYLS